jgi:hypothetical protein
MAQATLSLTTEQDAHPSTLNMIGFGFYIGVVLPAVVILLSPDITGETGAGHVWHPYIYGISSVMFMVAMILIVYFFLCRPRCSPKKAFHLKAGAAIISPLILIFCNVLLPLMVASETPDVYTGYLIGRLCFLVAVSCLFCIGNSYDKPKKQYDEGLYQLPITWSAFAIMFASDPVLTRFLYDIPGQLAQGHAVQTVDIPKHIILALVHLNYCGGITLIVLPLWKLNRMRRLIRED